LLVVVSCCCRLLDMACSGVVPLSLSSLRTHNLRTSCVQKIPYHRNKMHSHSTWIGFGVQEQPHGTTTTKNY